MRHFGRSLVAVAIGALAVVATGLPASAATEGCERGDASYGASDVCIVNVVKADVICPAGSLELAYTVTASGTPKTTVDLHWTSTGVAEVVQTDQPFSGTVAWPASIPKTATDVKFVVGTEAVVRVDPAAALAACGGSKVLVVSNPKSSGVLAATGSESLPLLLGAGALLLVGTVLVLARSARARRVQQ